MPFFIKLIEKLNANDHRSDLVNSNFSALDSQLTQIFYSKKNVKHKSQIFGSYSRKTFINDNNINLMFIMPKDFLNRNIRACNLMIENLNDYTVSNDIQSKFLDVVTKDGIKFSILTVFANLDGTFSYKVSRCSGIWSIMNPIAENIAFKELYREYNYLPISISKVIRFWIQKQNIEMSGYLSDTLVYHFFSQYSPSDIMYMSPDAVFKLFLKYMIKQSKTKLFWKAPGSNSNVAKTDIFHDKAEISLNIIESGNSDVWEEIFESSLISA